MNPFKRALTGAAASVLAVTVLAACGGGSGDGGDGDSRKISLGVFPNSILSLPTAVAMGEDFFGEEGLEVERVDAKTGPELIAGMIGGTTQIAGASTGTAFPAMKEGQDLKILPPFQGETKLVIATEKSGITELADLEGKTLAVPARGGDAETYVVQIMEEKGLDPSKITFLAAGGPPTLAAAMANGKADAAVGTTSSAELLEETGTEIEVLASPHDDTAGDRGEQGLSAFYATTADYYEKNADTVDSFCRAMVHTMEFMADEANKDTVVDYLAEWVGLSPEAAERVYELERDGWFTELEESRWQANAGYAGAPDVGFDHVVTGCGQN
ncbi:ABC transporter substrate-binding protein [Nocardioides albidus]|uniref:ABC transporter substrate-binding protein n=1 Tax=Nocardioides albidus TaxID=1517589 RepID=A0A5C4VZ38_9ACTN|nr:ABC transporter substrate-binding protein [Nocardioides albidus]TNM41180.1 ABC transporter substrate-binding protein [Nocardioides albidus]